MIKYNFYTWMYANIQLTALLKKVYKWCEYEDDKDI